jgi:hypothetical protein
MSHHRYHQDYNVLDLHIVRRATPNDQAELWPRKTQAAKAESRRGGTTNDAGSGAVLGSTANSANLTCANLMPAPPDKTV